MPMGSSILAAQHCSSVMRIVKEDAACGNPIILLMRCLVLPMTICSKEQISIKILAKLWNPRGGDNAIANAIKMRYIDEGGGPLLMPLLIISQRRDAHRNSHQSLQNDKSGPEWQKLLFKSFTHQLTILWTIIIIVYGQHGQSKLRRESPEVKIWIISIVVSIGLLLYWRVHIESAPMGQTFALGVH